MIFQILTSPPSLLQQQSQQGTQTQYSRHARQLIDTMTYSVTALKLLFSTVDYFRVIAGKLHIIENFLCVELPVNINRKHQHFARLTFSTLRTLLGDRKIKVTNFIFEWHPNAHDK